MLGALLDGIPENAALGATLAEASGVVLLVAVALGNTPEAIAGAAKMRDQHGMSHRTALAIWSATAAILVLVTVGSAAIADQLSEVTVATWQAFAGGATIAVLADALRPTGQAVGGSGSRQHWASCSPSGSAVDGSQAAGRTPAAATAAADCVVRWRLVSSVRLV
jgi:ZIP family zinc transporter